MKRILVITEASFLNTGFASLGRNLLTGLHKTGKYELAEFGIYGRANDGLSLQYPWTYYGNAPNENNPQEVQLYNSNPFYQFGHWRINDVILDFKPDICIDMRDPWHFSAHESPYRKFFKLLYQPTVDSNPYKDNWLAMLQETDGIFTYTDWGADVLRHTCGSKLNILGRTGVGIDTEAFKPVQQKKELRSYFGLDAECFLVGFFARNQKRKLFPDLLKAFRLFLDSANEQLAKKTFLYFHTSFPDIGFHFPQFLKEFGLGHKVLFTYICAKCNYFFPSFFQDAMTFCPKCAGMTAGLVNTRKGVPTESLHLLYNLLDVYVQYSISEGFGYPIAEAAACGIPTMVVDATGMRDFPHTLKSTPIEVEREFLEMETHAYRVYPNNKDFAEKLKKILSLPQSLRAKKGFEARQGILKEYNWNKIIKQWKEVIDTLPSPNKNWNDKPQFKQPNLNVPKELSNEEFVKWCLLNIACEPEQVGGFMEASLLKDLNYGHQLKVHEKSYLTDMSMFSDKPNFIKFDREKLAKFCLERAQAHNFWEKKRIGEIRDVPEFIQIAHKRIELMKE